MVKLRLFYLTNDLTSAGTLKSARYAWLITDSTGTPLIALDDQGKPLWKGTRDAGQYADAETGLYYNGFRYYDPLTGRYLQPDPLGLSGGLNSYTYALNNPLRYIDPEGQHPVAFLLIWTARFAVGWAIDYLIGYLPDNECHPLLSLQRWANAASYAVTISSAQKGVKALTAAAKLRRGLGGRGAGNGATQLPSGKWVDREGLPLPVPPSVGANGRVPVVLQSGGNTLNKSTANGLNKYFGEKLTPREWGRALEALKADAGKLPNNFHGRILDNGNYVGKGGEIIGNIGDYLP